MSIIIYSLPSNVKGVSIASLVVPGISLTITLSSPIILFVKEDFPALGFPTMAMCITSFSSSASSSSGKCFTTSSRRSPKPKPCEEEMEHNSPIPRE